MQEELRQQYLTAMGVDVWIRRTASLDTIESHSGASLTSLGSAASLPSEEGSDASPVVLKQDVRQLASWLSRQSLMPFRMGDVSVTTIGPPDARLLVLSECTVVDKVTHQPFSGRAALLLQAMLRAIGESFESVMQAELDTPHDDADQLLALLHKGSIKAILLMADLPPAENAESLLRLREHTCTIEETGTRVFITYHPDYLIARPQAKALAWNDLKKVRDYLASS